MKKITTLFVTLLLAVSILVLSACDSNSYTTGDNPSTSKTTTSESVANSTDTTKQETAEHEHQWIEATCTFPKTCRLCSKAEGEPLSHNWAEATCTAPKTCSICKSTEGSPLSEHDYQNGKCTMCNQAEPRGRVSGQLTYQYNKYVGTRGDNGATVMLIPRNDNVKNYDNSKAAMLFPDTYESGIIVVECDGYGNFDFGNSVPVGEYILVAISNETTSGQRFEDEAFWKSLVDGGFGNLFSDEDRESLYLFIGYSDWTIEILTIEPNDNIRFTHDFGYTYI